MKKTAAVEMTELGWVKAIAEHCNLDIGDVRQVLLKYGIRAQTTPPRSKSLRFESIKFSGVRSESTPAGPFSLSWLDLDAGIYAVMSERNLRGKSSILNMLNAAIRGDFPGRIKSDIWKWLQALEVRFRIDSVLHRLELEKDAGEEKAAQARAYLSRSEDGHQWVTLYSGDAAEGLKAQTEQLMMEELDFPVIYAHNKNTGGHAHGWPLISSAFYLSSSVEPKALFGDLPVDGIPLRLLQLFIGLPWVSTYSAALTAQKQIEQGIANRPSQAGTATVLKTRLLEVEEQLAEAKKARGPDNRSDLRLQLARLDETIAADRRQARDANTVMEADETSLGAISESFETARRRLKLLEEERSAGYSFRQLSPSCCPACEGQFEIATTKSSSDASCALCKNVLPAEDVEAGDDRIADAKHLVTELTRSVEQAKTKQKRSEADALAKSERLRLNMAEARRVQDQLSALPVDPDNRVIELGAQAKQLQELLSALQLPSAEDSEAQVDLQILRAASEISKASMTALQEDILGELTGAVMSLATKFGVSHLTSMHLDNGGKLKVRQGGADTFFTGLTMGEKLRIKIAIALAAVEVAQRRGHGRHPGLLIIDSPASEEVVSKDFEQMLDSVAAAARSIGGIQIIIGTIAREAVEAVVPDTHRLHAKGEAYLF
ncbi:hypothetical protein ACX40Y_17055 [Sphingomonas sp. RS6]